MSKEETQIVEELHERVKLLEAEIARLRESAQTHAALHRQDAAYYQMLVESMNEGLMIQDEGGRIIYGNAALCEILGVDRSEVIGLRAKDFVSPADLPSYESQMAVRMAGSRGRYELTWNARDGRKVRTLLSPSPIYDDEGNYRGSFAVITDLTEYRQAQQALLASEDRCREVLEHSRDIAYKTDLSTNRFEYISPSTTALTGYSPSEVMAMGPEELEKLVHPEDFSTYRNYGRLLVAKTRLGESVPPCEYRVRSKSGEYRWFSESASVVMDGDGRAIARIGTLRDITSSREAEEAVRAASRIEATTTLAGGIAHEFNNLMACVLGNAELLEMRMSHTPESKRMLQAICKSAEQGGDLARQMLAFARGGTYEPSIQNLNDLIDKVLRLEAHIFPECIQVVCELAPDLRYIKADRTQMIQVISNLTINAVEAIPGVGVVTIHTHNQDLDAGSIGHHPSLKPGPYVCLTVSDTGVGMSNDVRQRIFDPFFTTKFQGRGLGLAAVYGIVQNHQGHITVSSVEGEGSTFRVYFPAAKEMARPKRDLDRDLPKGHETVLVVDDEAMIRDTTRQILERLGYTVIEAGDGEAAVEIVRARERNIDLVLLDMAMPVMGGAEAYIQISKLRPEIKVILCSGYELGSAAQETLDRGAQAFLQKPFRIQTLAAEIRRVLDEKS